MCLILLAFQHHPDYPLVVAANRDEFYQRPTLPAHFWQEAPELFAGKDLQAGGTWMGITRNGRFAAVTNYRDSAAAPQPAISRGALCRNFLTTQIDPYQYLTQLHQNHTRYAGFNLLVGSAEQLFYYSNRQGEISPLSPGIHGLSNGLLNADWPKVESGKNALREILAQNSDPIALQALLLDQQVADDGGLPDTGIGLEAERMLSSRFIQFEGYGTRCTTVLRTDCNGHIDWLEQHFNGSGASSAIRQHWL
jgi:uncharacterized protein with NRDE domain